MLCSSKLVDRNIPLLSPLGLRVKAGGNLLEFARQGILYFPHANLDANNLVLDPLLIAYFWPVAPQ